LHLFHPAAGIRCLLGLENTGTSKHIAPHHIASSATAATAKKETVATSKIKGIL
jgi:hypothetical protein